MNDGATTRQEAANECNIILFVTGESPRSQRARTNLERLLQEKPGNEQQYKTIDVLVDPTKLLDYGIFATPALMVKPGAGDPSYLIGDLSDETKLREMISYCD